MTNFEIFSVFYSVECGNKKIKYFHLKLHLKYFFQLLSFASEYIFIATTWLLSIFILYQIYNINAIYISYFYVLIITNTYKQSKDKLPWPSCITEFNLSSAGI